MFKHRMEIVHDHGNTELKQTDAAAERRRSHSNLYLIKSD